MQQTPKSKGIASPYSTGGGGATFEQRVGAFYLALLLGQNVPRGLRTGQTCRIRFQRAYEGELSDDVIIEASSTTGTFKLGLQCKHDLTFPSRTKAVTSERVTSSDETPGEEDADLNKTESEDDTDSQSTFQKALRACWDTFNAPDFDPDLHFYGFGLSVVKATYRAYETTLMWARNRSNGEDFVKAVKTPKFGNAGQRSFLELMEVQLGAIAERELDPDEIWRFLRSFVLITFDLEGNTPQDEYFITAQLQNLFPPEMDATERDQASGHLWRTLLQVAADGHQSAGSYDGASLRQLLIQRGISAATGLPLGASPDCRRDLAHLEREASFALRSIPTDIARIELTRSELLENTLKTLEGCDFLLLTGTAGAGKSGLWKALVDSAHAHGPCLVLPWDRINGPGWAGQANLWNIRASLRELLATLSSASTPILFVDGLDRIEDAGARSVINDVVNELAHFGVDESGRHRWKIVATCRQERVRAALGWLSVGAASTMEVLPVPELTDDEIDFVATQIPRLKHLTDSDALRSVLRNPFRFNLLADQRVLSSSQMPTVATEVELARLWWERIVGQETGDANAGSIRQQTLLTIGERAVAAPGRWQPLTGAGIDARAINSLCQDAILRRDPEADRFRIQRDPLEEWLFTRVLAARREDITGYLQGVGEPLGLRRAVSLLGAQLLEKPGAAGEWLNILYRFESQNQLLSRWKIAWLTSPLSSHRASELLPKIEGALLEHNGVRLRELLVALQTIEVEPDLSQAHLLSDVPESERDAILMREPQPRLYVWERCLRWLLDCISQHEAELNFDTRLQILRTIEIWQRTTVRFGPDFSHRREIASLIFRWLDGIETENKANAAAVGEVLGDKNIFECDNEDLDNIDEDENAAQ